MHIFVVALVVTLFGWTFASAQLTNTTIFQLLNTSQVSPAYKFAQLLQSSPEYQPIVQLLSQPGNYTLFVPNDEAIQKAFPQWNQTAQESSPSGSQSATSGPASATAGAPSSGASSMNPSSPEQSQPSSDQAQPSASSESLFTSVRLAVPHRLKHISGLNDLMQSLTGPRKKKDILQAISEHSLRDFQAESEPTISDGLDTFSVSDVLYYHLVNQTLSLNESTPNVTIVNSVMANTTVDKIGAGMPLIITNGSQSGMNGSHYGMNGNQSNSSGSQSSSNSSQLNSNSSQSSSNGSQSGSNSNQSALNYLVGNGVGFANITTPNIVTSNGIIHVIDKVLVPPQTPYYLLQGLSDTAVFNYFVQQVPDLQSNLNNMSNVTIFAPVNSAFQHFDYQQMNNDTLKNLARSHICQGLIFTTNLTNSSNSMTAQSVSGTSLNLTAINSTSFHVNNATVVKPNILMDSGVLHIIDQFVVQPQSSTSTNTSANETSPVDASFAQHASASKSFEVFGRGIVLPWA